MASLKVNLRLHFLGSLESSQKHLMMTLHVNSNGSNDMASRSTKITVFDHPTFV